jgi:hypothetical protein
MTSTAISHGRCRSLSFQEDLGCVFAASSDAARSAGAAGRALSALTGLRSFARASISYPFTHNLL